MDGPKSLVVIGIILLLFVGQIPFALAKWVAVGNAPSDSGEHQVIFKADYNGLVKTYVLDLEVGNDAYPVGDLRVEPLLPISGKPPITLNYDISFNGTYDFTMEYNSLVVYYVSDRGEHLIQSDNMTLTPNGDGSWSVEANVPLKGNYEAEIWIVVNYDDRLYGGRFITEFSANSASEDLILESDVSKRIMTPDDKFYVYLNAIFEDSPLPELNLFQARAVGYDGIDGMLVWDEDNQRYQRRFNAPQDEGIYVVSVYGEDQEYVNKEKIYVADTSKAKSSRCPLSYEELGTCGDMADVRRCVIDYQDGDPLITESDLSSCFENVLGQLTVGSIYCNDEYRGDFDGDGRHDMDDLQILQDLILPLDDVAIEDYIPCADYDRDGDVDSDDLTCLTNVVSGKWFGDFQGGVCFDIKYDSPLIGDLNDDKFITEDDQILLNKLIDIEEKGVDLSQFDAIENIANFDDKETIDEDDHNCLNYFLGLDLTKPSTIPGFGEEIPGKCLVGYHLDDCRNIGGDLNGDLLINDVDELLINLIYKKVISKNDFKLTCADVNKDNRVTSEDAACVAAYLEGDKNTYFRCLGCDENTPQEYLNPYSEICGDGYDNDCDGYVDKVPKEHTICPKGYDDDCDSSGTKVTLDECQCNVATPCYLVEDADGGSKPGVSDGNVKVCRKVSWIPENDLGEIGVNWTASYQWMKPGDLTCDADRECESMTCGKTRYVCAYNIIKDTDAFGKAKGYLSNVPEWHWYDSPKKLAVESDDPRDSPKLCDDDYDNDCSCGDRSCKEVKWYDEFTTPQFWGGAVVGFAAFWACGPPCAGYALATSLASTGASIAIDDPKWSAAFSGFGLGVGLGAMASAAGIGKEAAKKAAAEATAKKTAAEAAAQTSAGGWGASTGAGNLAGDSAFGQFFLSPGILSESALGAVAEGSKLATYGIAAVLATGAVISAKDYADSDDLWDVHYATQECPAKRGEGNSDYL